MNSVRLIAYRSSALAQFCAVDNSFHMGDFVRDLLEARHINFSSVAKEMGVTGSTFGGYLRRITITEDVLVRMTNALRFDLFGLVQEARVKANADFLTAKDMNILEEKAVKYGTRDAQGATGFTIVINMADYDEDTALRIHKFLMQQPKKHPAKK